MRDPSGMMDAKGNPAEREAAAVVEAVRRAIPTSRHARMLFDMVRADLGSDAVVDSASGRTLLQLYRKMPSGSEGVVPHPLLGMGTKGRMSVIVPLVGSGEPPPRPGKAPRLHNLGPAEITLHDGPQSITVTYGEDGRTTETSRSASLASFAALPSLLAEGAANPVDLLAGWLVAVDLARHAPAQVHVPVPLPGGVAVVWNVGLWAIRDALFEGQLPDDAGWAVADGYAGTALALGATREEALAAWRREVEHKRPERPKPPPPPSPDDEPEGLVPLDLGPHAFGAAGTIRAPAPDVELPEPTPENTPAVVIRVDAVPAGVHPFGRWVRLLSRFGATRPVLRREDPGGFTLVGRRLAACFDLESLDAHLDAVPATEMAPPPPGFDRPAYDCHHVVYRLVDEETGEPIPPRRDGAGWSWGLRGRSLDGDALRWRAVRQRWIAAE